MVKGKKQQQEKSHKDITLMSFLFYGLASETTLLLINDIVFAACFK